ncbi:MAG: tRNA 2-methylthio-N6-isopentenyl adenosine(37) hydroxylase MiaE [Bacteroidetes bacterium]|nr:MAG: tRNA 2-methylthio-N6-isopentenyl adenosine(37) hydroxylase MiaE [Bacteroidota bacterium]
MLGLKSDTDVSWVKIVENNLQQLLTDHAFAEQKAAAAAVSLIINYSEETEFVQALSDHAIEEMGHFKMVHELMIERGYQLGQDQKSEYAKHLSKFFPKTKDRQQSLINRLLMASMIEARSCERFSVLSKHLKDKELAKFFEGLLASEAGHYSLFLGFARKFMDRETVDNKWDKFLTYEADYMIQQGKLPLVHG